MRKSFAGLEDLSDVMIAVLQALATWNYSAGRPTYYGICKKTQYSPTSVYYALKELRDRGIVQQSKKRVYYIPDELRFRILLEIAGGKVEDEAGKQDNSKVAGESLQGT